jgi:hypothetical protein
VISASRWKRFARLAGVKTICEWLSFCEQRGLAWNTVEAYGRALDDFLSFCYESRVDPDKATRHDVAAYIANLRSRPTGAEPLWQVWTRAAGYPTLRFIRGSRAFGSISTIY